MKLRTASFILFGISAQKVSMYAVGKGTFLKKSVTDYAFSVTEIM